MLHACNEAIDWLSTHFCSEMKFSRMGLNFGSNQNDKVVQDVKL